MSSHDRQQGAPERKYVSEFTRFMETFMANHPEARKDQRKGWQIFWDKQVDLKAQAQRAHEEIPTPGYYYFD